MLAKYIQGKKKKSKYGIIILELLYKKKKREEITEWKMGGKNWGIK